MYCYPLKRHTGGNSAVCNTKRTIDMKLIEKAPHSFRCAGVRGGN